MSFKIAKLNTKKGTVNTAKTHQQAVNNTYVVFL